MIVTVFLLIALAALVWGVISFNGLVRLRNQVRTAWADIDVQLKRRHDLVPQLVAAVQGYVGYERGVMTTVTELRSQALALTSPAKLGETETALQKGVTELLALKEAYPISRRIRTSSSFNTILWTSRTTFSMRDVSTTVPCATTTRLSSGFRECS